MLVVSLAAVAPARADGMLDPSFGNGGLVTTEFALGPARALSLVVLPDGRAVAAGDMNINLIQTDMAVARYLFSGDLDTTFGGDGRVTIAFPQQGGSYSTAEAVLLQADGRLVLIGRTAGDFFASFALARLNADGSLDGSFGTNGTLLTSFGAGVGAGANAGLLQPDGRIVAVGTVGFPSSVAAARYNPDGSLDPTFGGDGTVTVTVAGSFDAQAVVLQPDGKLVIAGTSPTGFSIRNFGLVRLLPDGTLDTSFGGDGIVSSDFGAIETGFSMILLPDGRLVVAGARTLMATPNSAIDMALARYLPDGSVDTTFGTGGLALASLGPYEYATDLIRLPDGNLLATGLVARKSGDFLLVRFLPDGVLDPTFGVDGFLRTNFGPNVSDMCNAAILAGPDLVLTAGSTGEFFPYGGVHGVSTGFALARYILNTGREVE